MELKVKRIDYCAKATMGELYINGKFFCYTLEDVVRKDGVKVYGETAIPAGRYKVIITMSNRFKVRLPLLQNVPNFDGIRIHPGNTSADTHGCLLVGTTKQPPDFIGNSKRAFAELFAILDSTNEEIYIDVQDKDD